MFQNYKVQTFDFFFPQSCVVCNAFISKEQVCPDCMSLCHEFPNPLFLTGKHMIAGVYYYENIIRHILIKAKFQNKILFAHTLLDMVFRSKEFSFLLEKLKTLSLCAVTFIPHHWINNIVRPIHLPSLFALRIAEELSLPTYNLLQKKGLRRLSKGNNKTKRFEQIKGQFFLKKNSKQLKNLLLVDDILTTGATFAEAQKVLKNKASEVFCLAIAKTP